MDRLGQNLDKLLSSYGPEDKIKVLPELAVKMISTLEPVHDKGWVHRDIKPDNFLFEMEGTKNLFLIDFGLAKRFRDPKGNHIPHSGNKTIVGTARYMSINAHLGCEQSRRDDLEALGFVFLYWVRGRLPWQGLRVNKKELHKSVGKQKQEMSIEELSEGCREVAEYMQYVRGLSFEERPDYDYLRRLFIPDYNSGTERLLNLKPLRERQVATLRNKPCEAIQKPQCVRGDLTYPEARVKSRASPA
ncbi:Palmitoylated plasma membrane-bound casein kinase [Neonectria magnoliae]|uniref:Palmitoylated plasma membrane-bound casein kinase n=1 Tax=Neonectria magnoliae TaxID=2732573 RepID=A0ABR1HIR0_9HYPO